MSLQDVVGQVRGRVDTLAAQGEKLAKVSLDALKQANGIVTDSVHTLVKDHSETARELFASAKLGLEKARSDGFKAVAANPIGYLPPRDKLAAIVSDTVTAVSKTGDELVKTVKSGIHSLQGEPDVVATVKSAAKPAVKRAKKAVAAAKKSVS